MYSVDVYYHKGGSTSFMAIVASSQAEAKLIVMDQIFVSHGITSGDISKMEVE